MPLEAPSRATQVASSGHQRPKRCPEVVGAQCTAAFAKQVRQGLGSMPPKNWFNRRNDDKPLLQGVFIIGALFMVHMYI